MNCRCDVEGVYSLLYDVPGGSTSWYVDLSITVKALSIVTPP